MSQQLENLQTEITKLKARLFDAGEQIQQQEQHYQSVLAKIASVAGFDVSKPIQLEDVISKIEAEFADVAVEEITE